ncbi:hypothetical protein ACMGT0_29225 [Pseudomonas sp. RHF3.3-3]|uniref:hypothetical protein n=1 Tax=Pseudomonas sp. RHF3.3-3 TaxID=3396624 RepID=UPI003A85D1CC
MLIGGEQSGFDRAALTLLLSQELILLLENRALYRTLDLGGETVLQVKALGIGLYRWGVVGQAIQWVITIATKQASICVSTPTQN